MLRTVSEWQQATTRLQFHRQQLPFPQGETSAEGNLFCSRPQSYRLFLNLGILCPKGSSAGLDGFSPENLKLWLSSWMGNPVSIFSELNSCESDCRTESTFGTSTLFLWSEFYSGKMAWWLTWSCCCKQYFLPVVRRICRIQCLSITSSKIRKSINRCNRQKGSWIGLTWFPLFDKKTPAQRKGPLENLL